MCVIQQSEREEDDSSSSAEMARRLGSIVKAKSSLQQDSLGTGRQRMTSVTKVNVVKSKVVENNPDSPRQPKSIVSAKNEQAIAQALETVVQIAHQDTPGHINNNNNKSNQNGKNLQPKQNDGATHILTHIHSLSTPHG